MSVVAKMHYEHGMTHQEIADQLGLARVKVTRTLAAARQSGVVQITVHGDGEPFTDVADAIAQHFGLARVWICPSFRDETRAVSSLSLTGGTALTSLLADSAIVAVGLSSVVAAVVEQLAESPPPKLTRQVSFVAMAGGWSGWLQWPNPAELPTRLASIFGGRALSIPAPLLATDFELASRIASMPEVHHALSIAASADTAVFGVGGLSWETYALRSSMTDSERVAVEARRAVGDTSARFFDSHGESVDSTMDRRVIGLTLSQMRAIPRRLIIAAGKQKVPALVVSLSTGLATHLCTDYDTARSVLAAVRPASRRQR